MTAWVPQRSSAADMRILLLNLVYRDKNLIHWRIFCRTRNCGGPSAKKHYNPAYGPEVAIIIWQGIINRVSSYVVLVKPVVTTDQIIQYINRSHTPVLIQSRGGARCFCKEYSPGEEGAFILTQAGLTGP